MATPQESFADAKRQAAIDHVLNAARRLVIANGLDATMEQIAETAGVSRRTLFRLFDSRERLIAAAFAAGMTNYSIELPGYDGDLHCWLRSTCEATHRMNSSTGPGFWELTSRSDLPPDLVATERRRRRGIRDTANRTATTLWQAAGGDGETPIGLLRAVGAHLSPHFTAAVMTDVGLSWQAAAELANEAILATLNIETSIRRESGGAQ